eukprot:SAG11_NODE_4_length_33019_cov_28.098909_21_plen_55_part_00
MVPTAVGTTVATTASCCRRRAAPIGGTYAAARLAGVLTKMVMKKVLVGQHGTVF